MNAQRTVPLYEHGAARACCKQHMRPGEFALHYSKLENQRAEPHCTLLCSLPEAEAYAAEALRNESTPRCRIYSHEGFPGAPVRELLGAQYRGEPEITARFRQRGRPALFGSRMLVPGLVLPAKEVRGKQQARRPAEKGLETMDETQA